MWGNHQHITVGLTKPEAWRLGGWLACWLGWKGNLTRSTLREVGGYWRLYLRSSITFNWNGLFQQKVCLNLKLELGWFTIQHAICHLSLNFKFGMGLLT